MINFKRYAMAGGVMATAAAIGFVMQNGDTAQARYAAANTQVPDISGTASDPLQVTDITLTSAPSDPLPSATPKEPASVRVAALDAPLTATSDATPPLAEQSDASCDVSMTAVQNLVAMVDVEINAPCFVNERVTIHHNGMMFTEITDETGSVSVSVPALAQSAVFIAAFANGEGALANAKVTALAGYDRLVVQSKASGEMHINAFEFGATYRDRGHVHAKSRHSPDTAVDGQGGFVTRLGNDSQPDNLVAEVYTFPTGRTQQSGDIHVSVDARVTTDNCGLRTEAQTLEIIGGSSMKVQDLTLPVPACDAVGDYVVLQNLLQDLKVASN
jgi:hypothetical protein